MASVGHTHTMARQRSRTENSPGPGAPLRVFAEWQGKPVAAGRLHPRVEGDREWAEFEPDARFLARPEARLLAPLFAVAPGPQRTGASMPLYGAVGDSAPDRWGRTLMRRFERTTAHRQARTPRVLRESDFLLGVNDEIRVGAVRFATRARGPFLGEGNGRPMPRVAGLPRLLAAVRAHEEGRESEEQVQLLLATGQLLGGSRPKATVRDDDGRLLVAKFPSHGDDRDMQRWEALALGLAADCRIRVPRHRLASVDGERVLLLERFDRDDAGGRIHVVTAYGLLGAQDNEAGSFTAVAEIVRAIGGRPRDDLEELWRRALFAVLISDKDNHLRNHGLMLCETGWRLCPAYDINAEAEPLQPRELLMSIDGVDNTASLDIALAASGAFGLELAEAKHQAREMAEVLRGWRERARRLRLPKSEIDEMRPAFDHADLERALRLPAR